MTTSVRPPTEAADFTGRFLASLAQTAQGLDHDALDRLAGRLAEVRRNDGRVFVVGLGGGAANASHAACDLRGLANVEAYAPTDSSAALTAAANDYGWRHAFTRWLTGSRLGQRDSLMVLSVGGGSETPPVSENLVEAVRLARRVGAFVCGVVGPDGGETARLADLCIRVPVVHPEFRTVHTEICQAIVWHLLISHPLLNTTVPRWESLEG